MIDPKPPSGLSFADLAAELQRIGRQRPEELDAWIGALGLRQQAELALRLPAQKRVELLTNAPRSMRLIRLLPDIDLYMTVREVGPADALPLLARASAPQLHHLMDLESWRKDRFDVDRAGAWTALLLEAGEPAIRRFLKSADDELLTLLVQSWMRVEQIEYEDSPEKHGHGEGDAGTEMGIVTPDGYHRFRPRTAEHAPAIRRILQMLFIEDRERYQRVLWESLQVLPSELEEQALRWKNSRLEERGYPALEEALDVYAPPVETGRPIARIIPVAYDDENETLAGTRTGMTLLDSRGPLAAVVDRLEPDRRDVALAELLSVANRLLVADALDTGDPDAHRASLGKAGALIDLALLGSAPAEIAEELATTPLIELFRRGWAQLADLRRRARVLADKPWAHLGEVPFELLDPPLADRLGALLEPRPRFVEIDDQRLEIRRREFARATEIEETRAAVEMVEALDHVLIERLGLRPEAIAADSLHPLRFSTLLLTLLAWSSSREELAGRPLPADVAADFLRNVASRRTAPPAAADRALEVLLRRLREPFKLDPRELAVLQSFGRSALVRLREECGNLDPGVPLDRRYVSCLLLAVE